MKFRYCLFIALGTFAVIYLAALQFHNLTKFDDTSTPESRALKSTAAPPVRRVNLQAATTTKTTAFRPPLTEPGVRIAVPRKIAPVQADLRPSTEPLPDQETHPAEGTETAESVARLADVERILHVSFAEHLTESDIRRFLVRNDCRVLIARTVENKVVDAFVWRPDRTAQRFSGTVGDHQFDAFRRDHPLGDHLYVRYDQQSGPVRSLAEEALSVEHIPMREFQVFLVLSRPLSREIQNRLEKCLSLRNISVDEVAEVSATLGPSDAELRVEIKRLKKERLVSTEGSESITVSGQEAAASSSSSAPVHKKEIMP